MIHWNNLADWKDEGTYAKFGLFIFMDDSRSGINDSVFCFWNIIIVDADGKGQTVLVAMTMHASNKAVHFVLSSLVRMTPERKQPVAEVLLKCKYFDACTCHIMVIDFPNALKNIHGYDACKKFVNDYLAHNTTLAKMSGMHTFARLVKIGLLLRSI